MRSSLFVIALAFVSLNAHAAHAPAGKACIQKAIAAGIDLLISPCGTPKQDPRENVISFVYVDEAETGPRYIPAEHCGWPDDSGLWKLTVRYKPLPGGDCRILSAE